MSFTVITSSDKIVLLAAATDSLTAHYHCHTTFHRLIITVTRHSTVDTLFGHDIFRVCNFPLWPFIFFCD